MLLEVAFDESGNTGQNLFDPEDPIFSLGSLHLSRDDATKAAKVRTFSDPNLKPFEAGYGDRTTRLPLLVDDIMAIDSKTDIRVQLADLLAGAAAACLKASFREATGDDGKFYEQLKSTMGAKQLFVGGIWPYRDLQAMFHDFPPNEPHPDQVSGPTYLTQILSGQPEVFRKPPPR